MLSCGVPYRAAAALLALALLLVAAVHRERLAVLLPYAPPRNRAALAQRAPSPAAPCCVGAPGHELCWSRPAHPFRMVFHTNELNGRGAAVAVFDYAAHFEDLACGLSIISGFAGLDNSAREKFEARFPGRVHLLPLPETAPLDGFLERVGAHGLYAHLPGIQSAWPAPRAVPQFLHGVFWADGAAPALGAAAALSPSIRRRAGIPVLPLMVPPLPPPPPGQGLREELGIAPQARVFCRHGGAGTFSVAAAREAVCAHALEAPSDYFLLLGTDAVPCEAGAPNIIHLPATYSLPVKARFLAACSACVHGRIDGETFGLAVAECSVSGLPVFTHAAPPPDADFHLRVLGEAAVRYTDAASLRQALTQFDAAAAAAPAQRAHYASLYSDFAPAPVMRRLLDVFGILTDVMEGGDDARHHFSPLHFLRRINLI